MHANLCDLASGTRKGPSYLRCKPKKKLQLEAAIYFLPARISPTSAILLRDLPSAAPHWLLREDDQALADFDQLTAAERKLNFLKKIFDNKCISKIHHVN